jgi:hypothetical protein
MKVKYGRKKKKIKNKRSIRGKEKKKRNNEEKI